MASENEVSGCDRSGAVCYSDGCGGDPSHRVRWEGGERWYGICEGCADGIPLSRGTVLEGLTPETITTHPVATDGGIEVSDRYRYVPVCNPCEMDLSHPVDRGAAKRIASRHQDRFGHSTGISEVDRDE